MNIVDEVVNKTKLTSLKSARDGVNFSFVFVDFFFFFWWMFTKPHTVVSFPNVALCEVNCRPRANGEL